MIRQSHALALAVALTMFTFNGSTLVAAEQAANANQPMKAEAVREHLDEAEDIVESLLRWKHVPVWPVDRTTSIPVDAPKTTLISIDQQEISKLTKFIDAMAAHVPAASGGTMPRGDLRAHIEKAQEISKELTTGAKSTTAANLVTIDRTSLERLEIELDAIEELLPRAMPRS